MKCYPEQFYLPPPGMVDFPFIYSFDIAAASGFTNGTAANNCRLQTDGDSEFLLRAVLGMQDVCAAGTGIQIFDSSQRSFFAAQGVNLSASAIWPVIPEKRWPRGGVINFNLDSVVNVGATYAKLLFQGVKRFPGPTNNPLPSAYTWRDRPWDLLDLSNWEPNGVINVNWPQGQPRIFRFNVPTYDFEFWEVLAANYTTGLPPAGQFAFRIWDSWPRPFMDSPIEDKYLIANCDGQPLAQQLVTADSIPQCFPCPPILYKANSIMQYEITPLVDTLSTPIPLQLVFRGQQRFPCAK